MGLALDLGSPLPVDPTLRLVRLANGFTCVVRRCGRPPGRVALWLRVASGSLQEEENERGLAHFLEHLAFRGSRHFPGGSMERALAELGLSPGRELNAFTTTRDTTYCLSLPDTAEATLRVGLLCLADIAWALTLERAEVERERRVILEEVRADQGADERVRARVLRLLLPGSRAAERHPLGCEDVIRSATRDDLGRYYRRSYRPDSTALLVVGDLEPARVEGLLAEAFAGWPVAAPAPETDPGIAPLAWTVTAVVTDPELAEAEVQVVSVWPLLQPRVVCDLRASLLEELGLRALNRRLEVAMARGQAPFSQAAASIVPLLGCATQARVVASCASGQTAAALTFLLGELRRLRLHGVLEAELEEACAVLRVGMLEAERGAATREAEAVLRELHEALRLGTLPASSSQRRELLEWLLEDVRPEQVDGALARRFDPHARLLLAIGPEGAEMSGLTEAELVRLQARVEACNLAPPAVDPCPQALLADRPVPGAVVQRTEDPRLGVVSVTLANGVRLHLRDMGFLPGRVFVELTLAGGRISESAAELGLTAAAASVLSAPATRALTSVQVRDLLATRTVVPSGWVDEDLVAFRVTSSADDLELALELVHLLLTEPRLEPPSLKRWRRQIEAGAEERRTSVEARLAATAVQLLTGDDPRFRPLAAEQERGIRLRPTQAWLEGLIASAPLEAAIVGDVRVERALDLARTFLGSMPPRPSPGPGLDRLRALAIVPGPLLTTVEVPTMTPRAAVLAGWRAAPWGRPRERRLLHVAEQILQRRLHRGVREEDGLSYATQCSYSPSRAYPAASMLAVAFATSPERTAEALARSRELVEGLAEHGPSDPELDEARRHLARVVEATQLQPQYWARSLADLDLHGSSLEDLATARETYLAFQAEEVRAVLARYVTPANHLAVVCRPAS